MPVPIIAPTPSAVSCTGPRMRRSRFSPAISLRSMLSGFVANRLLAMNEPPVVWFRSRSIHAGPKLLCKNAGPVAKAACAPEKEVQGQDLDQVVGIVVIEIGMMP